MVILEEWLHSSYVFISTERADSQGHCRRLFRGCLDGQSPVHRTLRDHSVYPVQFVLKELIRGTVTKHLPRKAIAPDFDLADLHSRKAFSCRRFALWWTFHPSERGGHRHPATIRLQRSALLHKR